jgi:hypothetical protein
MSDNEINELKNKIEEMEKELEYFNSQCDTTDYNKRDGNQNAGKMLYNALGTINKHIDKIQNEETKNTQKNREMIETSLKLFTRLYVTCKNKIGKDEGFNKWIKENQKRLVLKYGAITDAAKKEQEQSEKEYKEEKEQSATKESAKEDDECDKLQKIYNDKISTIDIALSKPTLTKEQYDRVKGIIDNLKSEIISCSNKGYEFDLNELDQYDIKLDNKFNNTTSSSSKQKESSATNDSSNQKGSYATKDSSNQKASSNEKESSATNSGGLNLDDLPPACIGFRASYNEYIQQKRILFRYLDADDRQLNVSERKRKDNKRETQIKTTLAQLKRLKTDTVRGTGEQKLNRDTKQMETCSENEGWYNDNKQWFINEFENIVKLSQKYNSKHKGTNQVAFIYKSLSEDYSVPEQKQLTEKELNDLKNSFKSGGKTKKSRRKRKSNISKKMRKKTKTIYKRKKMLVQTKRKK